MIDLGCGLNKQLKNFFDRDWKPLPNQKMRRKRGTNDLSSAQSYPDIHSDDLLPPITEQSDESLIEDSSSTLSRKLSLDSAIIPSHRRQLRKSDSKKSLSGIISKIMKQNRTTKMWKEETEDTKRSFRPKFLKSRSMPSGKRQSISDIRSMWADQGYESCDPICEVCDRDSSDEDSAGDCVNCKSIRAYKRSVSAPGLYSTDSADWRQRMASRHWQWYLRSSTSTWQSFNTDKTYCY